MVTKQQGGGRWEGVFRSMTGKEEGGLSIGVNMGKSQG